MGGAHEPLTRRAALDDCGRPGANTHSAHASHHRLPGPDCADRRRHPRAPTGGRHAADERAEGRSAIGLTHVGPREHGRARRRDSGIDRAAEPAEERDVDASDAETRVEPTHHGPARARQLVLDPRTRRTCRRRHDDPWAGDGNAHLQPVALVGGTGRSSRGQRRGHHRESPDSAQPGHQTPFKRKADVVAPISKQAGRESGEHVGDLAILLARAEPRAELLVHAAQPFCIGSGEELSARLLRDLLQRLRIRSAPA